MHRAWCCLREVPYCFSRSSVKFQGHAAKKASILTQIGRFRTVTPVWIHQWLRNDAQSLKYHGRGALLFLKVIRHISRSHGTKTSILTQIGRFQTVTLVWIHWWLWNDAQNLKRHRRGALLFFQGRPSNFKVTRDKKLPNLTRIGRFRTVTPVWIYPWLWNDAQSLI